MENEIKQKLIELYTELQNPSLLNASEVSNDILEIYSNMISIPVLIDIITNSDNQIFKQQASLGLKYSLSICSSQLDPSKSNEILHSLFTIIINENDKHNLEIILTPLIEIFKIFNCEWNIVEGFVNTISQTDLSKCFLIVSHLLPFISPEFVVSRFDYFSSMIDISISSPNHLDLFKHTYLIFSILANNVIKNHLNIYDTFLKKISQPFSDTLIVLLSNEQYFIESILEILNSLEIQINPFSLEKLFQPIIEALKNLNTSLKMKFCIILLFTGILSCDYSYKIDITTIQRLITSSFSLSIELFNNSDDFENPDSYIFSDFFYQCLKRIPNEILSNTVEPIIHSILDPQTPSESYNSIVFFDACLRRSSFAFTDFYQQIGTFLVNSFQHIHPGVRNEAAVVFCTHKNLIQSIEKVQVFQIIQTVINILNLNDFYYGLTIIGVLVDELDDTDPIFESTFSMCNQIIKNSSEIDTSLTQINWRILNNLIKHSKQIVLNVFDDIYSYCIASITRFISDNSDENHIFGPSMVKCLSSLSKSCPEKMAEKINEVFPLLIVLLKSSNDFRINRKIMKCFKRFISTMPDEVESYIYNFLKTIFIDDLCQASIKTIADLVRGRDYSVYVITPSINLLSKMLQNYPHFFNDTEMFNYILNIANMGINRIYEKEMIASLHLFKKILIFMNKSNLILPDLVAQFISIIIQKLKNEISEKVVFSMFDVINKAISIFGNSIIYQYEASLFQFVLTCVDHNQNRFTDEIEYNHVYNEKALLLLSNIIRSFYDNEDNNNDKFSELLVQNFIPRILALLNNYDPLFIAFGLNLISQIAISTNNLLTPEFLDISIQKALFFIKKRNGLTIPSIIFFDSLIYNYPQVIKNLSQQLVNIIEAEISSLDCSIVEQKCFAEYFITLLTILDMLSNNLIDEPKMKIIMSNLPITLTKTFNNKHIYSFFLKHLNDSQDLWFEIMKNIVIVFESTETIISSNLPQEIIANLLVIILQSGVINDPEALNALFNSQTDKVQNFIRTISFLSKQNIESS